MIREHSLHYSFPVFQLLFSYFFWGFLGSLIGFLYLLSVKPTAIQLFEDRDSQEDSVPGLFQTQKEVKYHRNVGSRRGGGAMLKNILSQPGQGIELKAADLNGIANDQFQAFQNAVGEDLSSVNIKPTAPGFHIGEGKIDIQWPLTFHTLGNDFETRMIARGTFDNTSGRPLWVMERIHINSAPLPFKNLWSSKLIPALIPKGEASEKIDAAWQVIHTITVEDQSLWIHTK